MGFAELLIIAVGLSMDAFAVSICKGLSVRHVSPRQAGLAALWFGGFQALMPLLGDHFVGWESDTLQSVVAAILTERGETLSAAESCTGGALSAKFTAMSGASDYFWGAVVSYDNSVKENVLGVSAEDIATYGAVSEQVARQMALRHVCSLRAAL